MKVLGIKRDTLANVEYKWFIHSSGKNAIRIFDLDASETVGVTLYPNIEHCKKDFDSLSDILCEAVL